MAEVQFPVYMDYNATTPVDERVLQAMLPYFTQKFGNAAATNHAYGRAAAEAVENARAQVAGLIGAEAEEIVFTSGATESVNLALKGVAEAYAGKGDHIITAATEHAAVLETCAVLEKKGWRVTYLPVEPDGRLNPEAVAAAITPQTLLIAVMYANNETGVIHPITEIGAVAKKHNVIFFCDAVQAAGKIPVQVNEAGIDLLAVSAHKMYGPKGTGALYIRRKNPRVYLSAQMQGGNQERGRRSGTLNVPGIVGLGAAAALCAGVMKDEAERLSGLRNELEKRLCTISGVQVNGSLIHRLPHVTHLSFPGLTAAAWGGALYPYAAVSGGSACATGLNQPSHVLTAMGLSREAALGAIRFSLGRYNTTAEVQAVAEAVLKIPGING